MLLNVDLHTTLDILPENSRGREVRCSTVILVFALENISAILLLCQLLFKIITTVFIHGMIALILSHKNEV